MKFLRSYWPLLVLILLTLLYFTKLFFPPQIFVTPDFGLSDILSLNFPIKSFLSESLKHGAFPLWSKDIGTGFPLLAEGQMGAFNFINLLLFLCFPSWLAFNLGLVSIFLVGGISTYLFCRKIGMKNLGSFLTSFSFTFSLYMTTQINHYNLIQTLSFFPLQLYFVEDFFQRKKIKSLLLLTFVSAEQLKAFFPQLVLYSLIFVLAFYIFRFMQLYFHSFNFKIFLVHSLLIFSITLLFLGLSAIQIIPSLELLANSVKKGGVDVFTLSYSPFHLRNLITFLKPFALGNPQFGTYPHFSEMKGIFWENAVYVSLVPLFTCFLFSVLYLLRKVKLPSKKRVELIFWFGIGLFSLILAFGEKSPFYFIFSLPPFNFFREPSRFLPFTIFSLTLLGGYCFDELRNFLFKLKLNGNKNLVNYLSGIIILFAIMDLFLLTYTYHPLGKVKEWLGQTPETAQFLAQQNNNYRFMSIGNESLHNQTFTQIGWWNQENMYHLMLNGLEPNLNLLYQLPSNEFYPSHYPRRLNLFRELTSQNINLDQEKGEITLSQAGLNLLSLQSVKYIVSPFKLNLENNNLKEVFQQSFPENNLTYHIYENSQALPRIYFSSSALTVDTISQLKRLLSDPTFDPQTAILIEKDIAWKNPSKDKISPVETKIFTNTNAKFSFEVETKTKAFLVVTDSFYPDWKAYDNGKRVEILAANGNQRALLLEPGYHVIDFVYDPKSFKTGLVLSLISLVIWTILYLL